MDEQEKEKDFIDHATQVNCPDNLQGPINSIAKAPICSAPEWSEHPQIIAKLDDINFSLSILIWIVFVAAAFHVLSTLEVPLINFASKKGFFF